MRILSIETSCDETAVSIVEASGELESPTFSVLANALFSQIDIHKEFGGVYPMMAKREHSKNLPKLIEKVLKESSLQKKRRKEIDPKIWDEVREITKREEGMYEGLRDVLENLEKPDIDVIAVTSGPGLAPALWVGISCALALGKLWNIHVLPINHMEGHIASILIENPDERKFEFPALALLISGGHTELVSIVNWGKYNVIGQTRDDAVGEAFDKVARMLDLPYPGGPEISKLAQFARTKDLPRKAKFSRPMIHSGDSNFSFSGLKTAVLYYIRDHKPQTQEEKADIAREFEDTVIDVLLTKTKKALEEIGAKTLIVAGGVIANRRIRELLGQFESEFPGLIVKVPTRTLSTDNSLMIAAAAYINLSLYPDLLRQNKNIIASGNLKLGITI